MREYLFEDLTLIRRVIKVTLYEDRMSDENAFLKAEVTATCGPLPQVLEKEGVELISATEQVTCQPLDLEQLKTGYYWYRTAESYHIPTGTTKKWADWETVQILLTRAGGEFSRCVFARHWSNTMAQLQKEPGRHQFRRIMEPTA